MTELPSHELIYPFFPKDSAQQAMATFGRFFHDGLFDLRAEKTLNQVFSDIEVSSVRDVLERAWGKH